MNNYDLFKLKLFGLWETSLIKQEKKSNLDNLSGIEYLSAAVMISVYIMATYNDFLNLNSEFE